MKSNRGVLAAVVFLLSIPTTVLATNVLGANDEVMIHVTLGTGFAILAFAVFDFNAPRWMNWVCSLSMATLAGIFYLQGLSKSVDNDALHDLAFDILGQGFESALVDVFVIWCFAVLLLDSHGKTRLFGMVAVSLVISTEVIRYGMLLAGDEAPEVLKLLLVLPIVWLLLESRKKKDAATPVDGFTVLAPSSA